MLVILVSGKAGHGKDTFASYLKDILGENEIVEHINLAYVLKQEALEAGWNGRKDEEGRSFLQWFGEKKREEDIYYCCKKLEKIIPEETDILIVGDCRQEHEVNYFREKDYEVVTIRVIRYVEGKPFENNLTEEQKNDTTETGLDNFNFDIRVHYDEGLKEVQKMVKVVAHMIEEGKFNEERIVC